MEQTTPRLSVVIPVYNGEAYIGTMVQCFREQKVQNFELIFVDDGSTDTSLSLLHSYARTEDFPMKVVELEPKGVSAARNAGLDLAEGEYISFVDVDDRIVPEYTSVLEDVVAAGQPFDLFFFRSERVSAEGPFETLGHYNGSISQTSENMLKTIGSDATKFGVYNMFLRGDFVRENHFRFAKGYAYYEDYDYLFRVTAKAKQIRMTADRLYYYLLQDGSAVATFSLERLRCISLLEDLVPFLKAEAKAFVPMYENFVLPRIWWSVMWQACLAFSMKDALAFGKAAHMRDHMKLLKDASDPKVANSAKLYLANPPAFVAAAAAVGRTRSKIERTDVQPFLEYLKK